MSGFITSANAIYTLTVSQLFNAPITLQNWGADRGFEQEALEMAETQMSIDGHLNRGYVPRAVNQTLTFSPVSDSILVFEAIISYSQQERTVVNLGAELVIPDISRRYTFTNGCIMSGTIAPNAGGTLENRTFTLQWERVIPAGL